MNRLKKNMGLMSEGEFSKITEYAGSSYSIGINPLKELRKKYPEYDHRYLINTGDNAIASSDVVKPSIFYALSDEKLVTTLTIPDKWIWEDCYNF